MRAVAEALGGRRLYKKVDSTMRGNVGYELRAIGDVLRPRGIVVARLFHRAGVRPCAAANGCTGSRWS